MVRRFDDWRVGRLSFAMKCIAWEGMKEGGGDVEKLPIFIGGEPRSGTTFLGDFLGSFSKAAAIPEMQFKMKLIQCSEPAKAKAIRNEFRFKLWGIAGEALDSWGENPAPGILRLAEEYLHRGGRRDFIFWVDHTPDNIRYARVLKSVFPKGRFVHIIRDPRAVTASVLPLPWGPNTAYREAVKWKEQIARGLSVEAALPARDVLRVHYEDLIKDPMEAAKRIGIHFGIHLGDYVGSDRRLVTSYSRSLHELVGKAPDPSRIVAWKEKLSRRDIEIVEYYCGEIMENLGYNLVNSSASRKRLSTMERMGMMAKEYIYGRVNRWKCERRNRSFLRTGY